MGKIRTRQKTNIDINIDKIKAPPVVQSQQIPTYTPGQLNELLKCHDDPIYFIENYLAMPTIAHSAPLILRPYQRDQIRAMESTSMFSLQPRQSGATIIPLAFQLWNAIFRSFTKHGAAFVNQGAAATGMSVIHNWFASLPQWLKPGVVHQSPRSIELDNSSSIHAGLITPIFNQGRAWRTLFADSMAFAPTQDQEDFWYSSISSVANGRVFITGSPNGPLNAFASIWTSVTTKQSSILPIYVQAIDAFNPSFLSAKRAQMPDRDFRREYHCEFIA